jgi:hypothetical protein
VTAALAFPWPPSVAYAGLLGLAVAAIANHVLIRRASCTVTPNGTAQQLSEKPCPSCRGETPEQTAMGLRV